MVDLLLFAVLLLVAIVSTIWLIADRGGSRIHRTDAGTTVAVLLVLSLPVLHLGMTFAGYTANPRHFVGDYFRSQQTIAIGALTCSIAVAVVIIAAAAIGLRGRRRSGTAAGVAASLGIIAVAFAGFEGQLWVRELIRLAPLIGTIPM
jgi:hypothetical protein